MPFEKGNTWWKKNTHKYGFKKGRKPWNKGLKGVQVAWNKGVSKVYLTKQGYVSRDDKLEHRTVIERHLGRKLSSKELVHHKDGKRTNNKISNLELTTRAEHAKYHGKINNNLSKHNERQSNSRANRT